MSQETGETIAVIVVLAFMLAVAIGSYTAGYTNSKIDAACEVAWSAAHTADDALEVLAAGCAKP